MARLARAEIFDPSEIVAVHHFLAQRAYTMVAQGGAAFLAQRAKTSLSHSGRRLLISIHCRKALQRVPSSAIGKELHTAIGHANVSAIGMRGLGFRIGRNECVFTRILRTHPVNRLQCICFDNHHRVSQPVDDFCKSSALLWSQDIPVTNDRKIGRVPCGTLVGGALVCRYLLATDCFIGRVIPGLGEIDFLIQGGFFEVR